MKDHWQKPELIEELTDMIYSGEISVNEARARLGLPALSGLTILSFERGVDELFQMEMVENDCS